TKNTPLSMGVMIARTEFLEQNKDAVLACLVEYNASTQYVNNNVADAAALSEKFDIMAKAVAEKAIPRCNIVCIEGKAMVTSAKQLLEIFYNANPKSVGGSLPDESFYYQK
ncbi:MAG: ABC transporter substrate-binding protein, partial [Oscillospiraceae bacterium]|nr:ABC transporter substrate-binding protein [Oscillospiraceae bacterium]